MRKVLAFLRAQILWNEYRMDPQYMQALMMRYGPMDWRSVWAHGLYWSSYGCHVVERERRSTTSTGSRPSPACG